MFETRRRIEFCDTDMAGIVHFSNYFRFMEAAECEFLRSRGLTVSWHEGDKRFGFPRVSATCSYVKPVRFEDVLTIGVTVEKIGRKSIEYRFDFSHDGQTIATGRTTAVFCQTGDTGHLDSLEISEEMRKRLTEPV